MYLGRHLSIKEGYAAAAKAAYMGGISAFQYFPKNPRSLGLKSFDRRDAERCAELCKQYDIVTIAHSPYPTNLASEREDVRQRTVESLLNDLDIANSCGSIGVVVHFGVYKGKEPLLGYQSIIRSLDEVTSRWDGDAKLLIEIQSGEHTFMGTTIEELAQIRGLCSQSEKLAFCLDTCHMFASGLWHGEEGAVWLNKAAKLGVLDHVAAIHFNDSMFAAGARRDRHAALGSGHIGEAGLKWLMTVPALNKVPFILETPSDEDGTYARQLNLMREWGTQ
ncbi:deoxyribonuclease IV [Paenibacillus lupini]|uniref:deoxyribonuclease IV n=1 Tax=Paenibacillus lupini TaxID=1450204 RepID=UPI00141FD97D|nr:deoxyribonuclease IV [Paenibacillus lupini]NIK21293.1 deoxyribonuclease-4 [Paenibacillus lupini]